MANKDVDTELSQELGGFIEWLEGKGVILARFDGVAGGGYVQIAGYAFQRLLEEYVGFNPKERDIAVKILQAHANGREAEIPKLQKELEAEIARFTAARKKGARA